MSDKIKKDFDNNDKGGVYSNGMKFIGLFNKPPLPQLKPNNSTELDDNAEDKPGMKLIIL